jgi:uncharacterized protein
MSASVQTAVGQIVWHDLVSTEVDKAKSFYTKLLGWELEVWKPGEMDYPMITANDMQHGGFVQAPEGVPSHWLAHVVVDDADAAASRAKAAGGKLLMDPMDIAEVGRMITIADPQGAVISLFTPAGDIWETSQGTFVWDELLCTDVEGARSFYRELLGWTAIDMDMGEFVYTIFKRNGDKDAAGAMKKPEGTPGPPAAWLTYLATADVDASVQKATQLGATTFMPGTDVPNVGRLAVLQDPTGAAFGLFKPNQQGS